MPWAGYSEKGQGSEERGPSTFTYQPPGVVQAQAGPAGQAQQVHAGVRGQSGTNTTYVPPLPDVTQDQTYKLLVRFGSDAIAKQADAAKNEQFLKGFTRAAQGEAMADILNEQPWYGKIFGDGPLVEGARAYTVESTAANWAGMQEQKMQEWKMHSPDKIPGMLAKSMQETLTGDPATDALTQQKMLTVMPQLIKRQTKEHYKYQQETASRARIDAITSSASLLKFATESTPGVYTPEEIQQRKDNLLSVSTPTVGADPDAYAKDLTTAMGILAEQGNFHAVNVYRENGVLAKMDPERRLQTERYINQFETKHASDATMQYVDQIAQIKEDAQNGVISAKQVRERYDAINNDYRIKSGNSQPILRAGTYITDERAAASAVIRNTRAAGAAAASTGDFTQARQGLQEVFNTGGAGDIADMGGKPAALLKATFYQEWRDSIEGVAAPKAGADGRQVPPLYNATNMLVVNARGGYTNPLVKNHFETLINSGNAEVLTPPFIKAFELWKAMDTMPGSAAAKAQYFGAHDDRMQRFNAALAGADPRSPQGMAVAEAAYQTSLVGRAPKGALNKEDKKVLTEFAQGQKPGGWFSSGMTPQAQETIVAAIRPHYENTKQFSTGVDSTQQALERAKAGGLEVIGVHAVRRDPNQRPLRQYFTDESSGKPFIPAPEVHLAFDGALKVQMEANGIDAGAPYSLLRTADVAGAAQYVVLQHDGGSTKTALVTSTDVETAYSKRLQNYGVTTVGQPQVRNDPRMPALGASAEEWAAYRALQKREKGK